MSALITPEQWAELRRASLDEVPQLYKDGRLPSLLMSYQARGVALLESVSTCSVLVVEKSRRVGYTWALAAYAVLRAAREKSAGGMDAMYISYSQDMTREFVDACGMWARAYAMAAAEAEEFLFDDVDDLDNPTDTRQIKAFRIKFASGFEIIALSSAPRSLRGKQGVVIIDEAAFIDSLAEVLKAALAFLMWGGQVVVVSTHNGALNPFNELVQDTLSGKLPYKHHHVDFDEALKDGLYQRICLMNGQTWTPEGEAVWRAEIVASYGAGAAEELFCVPSQSAGAYLPRALIEANMTEDVPVIRYKAPAGMVDWGEAARKAEIQDFCTRELLPHLERCNPSWRSCFGQDFARNGDGSVLIPCQVTPNLRRQPVFVLEMRDVPFECQRDILFFVVRHLPRFRHGALDATGNGAYLAEVARQKIGASCISEIKLSTEWYRLNMPKYKSVLEDFAFDLPKDDDVLTDHRSVKMENGIAKVPEGLHTKGADGFQRHGDVAIAAALTHFASNQDGGEARIDSMGEERPAAAALAGFEGAFADASASLSDYLRM